MTFPAFFEFVRDVAALRHPAAIAVYGHILQLPGAFHTPQELKAWYLADLLHFEKTSILEAFNLLVERGYLIEHDRGQNNVRRFTVCITRATNPAA